MKPKPNFPGKVRGQVISSEKFVRTSGFLYVEKDEETIAIPIKKKQIFIYWVWDGNVWLSKSEWDILNPLIIKKSNKFPSKNDFDDSGNIIPARLRNTNRI